MNVSQKSISRQVGVSRTAVSHVLNGREHMVSADTRQRILAAVAAAGYHRNALVRSIRSNRTHVIGIVVPDASVSFFGEIIRAVERAAKAEGLRCFLCQTHCDPAELGRQIAVLLEYRVDGILVVPASATENADTYRALQQQHMPFVLVDVPSADLRTSFVGTDNRAVGELATTHLLALGHRRIAYVRGYSTNPATDERQAGHLRALTKAGLRADESLIVGDGFTFDAGTSAVVELFHRQADFTAIVASSDFAALGAIAELSRHGKSVPRDVSVIGCGNLDVSGMVVPPLTTVNQRAEVLGARAMALLSDHIAGRGVTTTTTTTKRVIVKPTLVVRESAVAPIAAR